MERWTTFRQWRRDLQVLRLRAQGGRLSPLVRAEQPGDAAPPATPDLGFRQVRIDERVQETLDTVSFKLSAVGLPLAAHRAGQFLTLEVVVDGKAHRRAYSISAAEGDDVQVCVKRIDNGLVSTYLTKAAKVGDTLRVLGPSGSFGFQNVPKHALIVAGGSGITPCIAIAETLLRGGARVSIAYGSRSWNEMIFRERLQALSAQYPQRLVLDFVTDSADPRTTHGRLDAETLRQRLCVLDVPKTSVVFLCGPAPMMEAAKGVFAELELRDVREERFVSARPKPSLQVAGAQTITILRQGTRVEAPSVGTLLESGLAAGVDMPFSCSVGGCAACKVKLVDGEVHHDELSCLSEDEKRMGYVLACCAEATSSCTIELPSKETP